MLVSSCTYQQNEIALERLDCRGIAEGITEGVKDTIPKLEPLINAMILVESRGDDSAYHTGEKAVGCLQIRPIMLKECNRILELIQSSKRYNLIDRWSRRKSIEIFTIINQYHNKDASYEEIARFWNGGPSWIKKSGTKKYWKKVQKELKTIESDEYSYYGVATL